MKKIYTAIAVLLVAGIAASLWYTEQDGVTITYGTPTVAEIDSETKSDIVADVPQTGTGSASPATSVKTPVVIEQPRQMAPTCESVRITIDAATYVPCIDGEVTVLAAMQTATKDGLVFTGRDYPSFGFFVDAINGKAAGSGYYWFLYINDTSSSLGASQTHVKAGDVVEWRYKQSY